jgi:trk system potassium uptake protein TrkH
VAVFNQKQGRKNPRAANPGRVLAFSFFAIIMVGTFLLTLPISSRYGRWTNPLTALFTATSATCVTGLSTVNTGVWWSHFGQLVLLCMIQLGGLGFMTLLYTTAVLLRRRLSISRQLVLMGALNLDSVESSMTVARHALAVTFTCEGIGALLLSFRFVPEFGWLKGLWYAVFHSVSAFCNAGFDLVGGMEHYALDPLVNFTLIGLILCSGLGFFTWEELLLWFKKRRRLSLSSRLVLLAVAVLVVSGTLFFFLLEQDNPATMGNFTLPQKWMASLFQSVTLRTAGFATVSQASLTESSQALSIVYMLIGGASGSTAGGIKVNTIIVLLLGLRAGLVGKEQVTVRSRTIHARQVFNAMTLTLLAMLVFFLGAIFVSVKENCPFLTAAFETASAIATVGLSADLTATLSPQSQIMIILMMYLGRVGILSFSFAVITHRPAEEKITYPYMDMMIG